VTEIATVSVHLFNCGVTWPAKLSVNIAYHFHFGGQGSVPSDSSHVSLMTRGRWTCYVSWHCGQMTIQTRWWRWGQVWSLAWTGLDWISAPRIPHPRVRRKWTFRFTLQPLYHQGNSTKPLVGTRLCGTRPVGTVAPINTFKTAFPLLHTKRQNWVVANLISTDGGAGK
jgi:hypothetical protein